ncbi:phage antirepressor KilAC domain-containing protein [Thomasclavelia cocleata]|nr:phage antirepressor KilAC domain-containing protein [Thomasclavelia cocleata]
MNQLQIIEHQNQRVLLTSQLAESYGTTTDVVTKNFNRNKERYQEGKHYFTLEGVEKKEFIDQGQFDRGLKNAKTIYLWTERGAFLHAKSLNTDKAWEVYDSLVEHYFKSREAKPSALPSNYKEALLQLLARIEENEKLELSNKIKDQQIAELKPKADYCDLILKNKGLVTISQIAKDYGKSGKALNNILHNLGIQYKQSGQWLLYSKYQNKGYTQSETIDITRSNGMPDVKMNTKWTQKGRLFLYELLKANDILPMIEQNLSLN